MLQGCRNAANPVNQPIPGLVPLTALQHLSLRNCDRLLDGALLALTRMSRLEVLDISGCQQLTGGGLVPLGRLASLHTLKLQHWTDSTGDGVKVGFCLLVLKYTTAKLYAISKCCTLCCWLKLVFLPLHVDLLIFTVTTSGAVLCRLAAIPSTEWRQQPAGPRACIAVSPDTAVVPGAGRVQVVA